MTTYAKDKADIKEQAIQHAKRHNGWAGWIIVWDMIGGYDWQ